MIRTLTAKGGTASVNQRPIAKNRMKSTYTCVVVNDDSLSNKVTIDIDFGESKSIWQDTRLKTDGGNIRKFNTVIDALNYMGKQGWKLVFVAPRAGSDVASYYYTFQKEFDVAELKRDEN